MGHEFGQHDECDPDTCFAAKMRYIREAGGLAVRWQGGKRSFFHESTIPERQRQIVERARKNGWEARPLNPLYDRPANFSNKPRRS